MKSQSVLSQQSTGKFNYFAVFLGSAGLSYCIINYFILGKEGMPLWFLLSCILFIKGMGASILKKVKK